MLSEQTTFFLVFMKYKGEKDGDHKERRLLLMSMTILRKLAGIKRLKDL